MSSTRHARGRIRPCAALWAYATCQWLSLRVPTSDETRSRCPVDPRWTLIQKSSLRGGTAPAVRIKEGQRQGELRTLRKLATGVLSSMALPLSTNDIGLTAGLITGMTFSGAAAVAPRTASTQLDLGGAAGSFGGAFYGAGAPEVAGSISMSNPGAANIIASFGAAK